MVQEIYGTKVNKGICCVFCYNNLPAKNVLSEYVCDYKKRAGLFQRSADLENHLYKTYDKIDEAEELLISAKTKKSSLLADKITGDNIYKALVFFDKLYAQMNEAEKREFLSQLVDNVQIYEERKENGQWLKSIEFKLPIIEKEFALSLDNDTQNETVVRLSHKKPDGHINVKVEFGEGEGKVPLDNIAKRAESYKLKERVTYKMIKEHSCNSLKAPIE